MVEIEQITEYKNIDWWDFPYLDDSLFEYVNALANHFWYETDVDFDEKSGEQYAIRNLSYVPYKFARRYLNGDIDTSRLKTYLLSVTGQEPFKHKKLDDIGAEKVQASHRENIPDISMTLKAYNLDISKFWYLCICIKDWVDGKTCEGARIHNPTHRQELQRVIQELNKLNPKLIYNGQVIRTTGKAELTLKVNGKKYTVDNTQTLSLINWAIQSFLNPDGKPIGHRTLLDTSELGGKRLSKSKSKTVRLALFYQYLHWFLEQREVDNNVIESYQYTIQTNKDLLISRMAYLTGLTDDKKFLVDDNFGKGHIRAAISGYENIELCTDNKYYGNWG